MHDCVSLLHLGTLKKDTFQLPKQAHTDLKIHLFLLLLQVSAAPGNSWVREAKLLSQPEAEVQVSRCPAQLTAQPDTLVRVSLSQQGAEKPAQPETFIPTKNHHRETALGTVPCTLKTSPRAQGGAGTAKHGYLAPVQSCQQNNE